MKVFSPLQLIIQNSLWAFSFGLQVIIVFLLTRRKQNSRFPVFFAYSLYQVVEAVASFAAYRHSYTAYFYEWWAGELINSLFILAVIQEIFTTCFEPYEALRKWSSRLYMSGSVILCAVSVLLALHSQNTDFTTRVLVLVTLQRSVAVVQIGLLVFLFAFCRVFGLTWRHYVFGIAVGFVIMSSIATVSTSVTIESGNSAVPWTSIIKTLGFVIGTLVWTFYFASRKSVVPLNVVPGTAHLVAWNRALAEIGQH